MLLKPHSLPRFSHIATSFLRTPHNFPRALQSFVPKTTMSTTTSPTKYDWICIMPYHLDASERRLKHRPAHVEGFKSLFAAGIFNFGGPFSDETPADGGEITPRGSVMGCVAESKEAVIAILKKDSYSINNVWNWEKANIFPYDCVMRTALKN